MATSRRSPFDICDDDEDWEVFDTNKKEQDEATPFISKSAETEESDSKTDNETRVYEPEGDKSTELAIKLGCDCSQCHHWRNSVDWCTSPNLDFENHSNKIHKVKKTQPLLRSDKHVGTVPKICSFDNYHLSKTEKLSASKILVHGEIIPQPVELSTDTHFHESVYSTLQSLNYKYSLLIQSFVWPAIFRQLNVFMISGRKTGKTMAYLPAMCTFAFQEDKKYEELTKYKGPVIVIVCPNSRQCEEIFDLIKKIYCKIHIKPKVSIITYPVPNINTTDILITMPESLVYCIKTRIFNLKRLCHLVFENTSVMLKNDEENIYRILNVVNEMLEHRSHNAKVQLIVSSEKWTVDLKKLLKSIYATPLVCIGNYLEAALYGAIQFEVKFLISSQKKAYVEGILKNQYHIFKTVIICNDSEITQLNKWLVRNGIETVALSDNSSREDIEEYEILWNSAQCGQYKVLLCSDFVLDGLLSINDAIWLVHYSFPSTWTRFSKRFSALSSRYQSPLVIEDAKEKIICKSFLIIDEACEKEMPKILNLLNRLSKDLPPTYQKYAEGFKIKTENEKIARNVDLCENTKLFGKCSVPLCIDRHMLSDSDVSENLPKNGKIVFKILAMKDVTHYIIQLREHIDLNGHVRKIDQADLKQPLTYSSDSDKKRAKDIEVGKFYVHCDRTTNGEVFMLCQVLKIENENFVEVKLMTGVTLQTLHTKLYEPPPELEVVDMYLCNLIPPHKDIQFSGRSYHLTRKSLESNEYRDRVFTGDIHLQLHNTFWLDNVLEIIKVAGSEVVHFNLTKHLIELKVVERCKSQITSLYKLCEKCEITLPCYVKPSLKKTEKEKKIEPQSAFLEEDSINEVILSSAINPEEFYVRLSKYQDLLDNLEKDINKLVETEVLDKNLEVVAGNYYLALDPQGTSYSRVKVLKTENGKALCFYVDYGDEAVKDTSEMKKLPTKYITRLPFQAIQCRLHGLTPSFDEWEDEATDVLYKYMFEPESDFFRSFFVKVCETVEGDCVRSNVRYSVLLKDGYGNRNVLINQLLLDCGFATSIFGEIDDFDLPNPQIANVSDSESDESYREPPVIEDEQDVEEQDVEEEEDEDVDLVLFDEEQFFDLFFPWRVGGTPNQNRNENHQIEYENRSNEDQMNNAESNLSPESSRAEEKPNHLTPEVYWSQNEKTVKLKIKLIGVENYKINVIRKKIFTFSTKLDEKSYALKFTLCKPAHLEQHSAKGQEVQAVLNKVEPCEWLQLTGTNKRLRNIHYEITEDEEDKPRRKFLQLDIPDDESDDEGDNIMYTVESDLDSEFDQEVVSSSSE